MSRRTAGAARHAVGSIDRAHALFVVAIERAQRIGAFLVLRVHGRAFDGRVSKTEHVPDFVGQHRIEVVGTDRIGRAEEKFEAIELEICVPQLARVGVELEARESKRIFGARVRPGVVAKHDDVRVLLGLIVLRPIAGDGPHYLHVEQRARPPAIGSEPSADRTRHALLCRRKRDALQRGAVGLHVKFDTAARPKKRQPLLETSLRVAGAVLRARIASRRSAKSEHARGHRERSESQEGERHVPHRA